MAKRRKKRDSGTGREPFWVAAFRRGTWAIVLLLICGAAAFAVRAGWQAVAARPEFRVDSAALTVSAFPDWVNGPEMIGELRQLLDRVPSGRSLFDPDIARIVRDELASCPWLLEVTEVRRELPNSLRVTAVFRKPAGIASYNGRRYMVDADGYWLPDRLFLLPGETPSEALPVIQDSLLRRAPVLGRPWDEQRMAVGARLTQFIQTAGLLKELPITRIDVSGVGRAAVEPDITMTVPWVRDDGTAGEATVKWGKSSVYSGLPGLEEPILEVPDGEKVRMLLTKAADYPHLRGILHIDPRFHNQIVFAEAD